MALGLRCWVDVTSVRPGDAKVHLVMEVAAREGAAGTDGAEASRPPATTVLAIDVSGSMQGEPLDHVVRSVDRLLDALGAEDRVAVVAFSDGATRVVEPTAVDAAGKRLVRARVARLFAEGQTNVEAGLELSAELLAAEANAAGAEVRRRGVVLLSDGQPNRGASTADALRAVVLRHRSLASFSSLGYGTNHAEDVLSAVGDAGGGGYEYVPDPATCARAFARALGAQADVVASSVEIAIAPAEGVEIARLLGGEPARFGRDGLTVALADMVPGMRRVVVAELSLRAPSDRFLASLGRVRLGWKSPGAGEASSVSEDVSIEIAEREPGPVAEALVRVMLVRADRVREEARALADRGNWGASATTLRRLLAEIDRVPGFAAGDGSPLAEAYELLVDEAMAMERRPDAEAYAKFRKSAVASRVAMEAVRVPAAASSRGPASSRLLEHAAGRYPEAFVVVKTGARAGDRHRLKEECVIGRTASADVPIESPNVSRRHAEIYALEGEFWACDLGSTNVTKLNGAPLGTEPRRLRHGDVVLVGDVELVYEEPGAAPGGPTPRSRPRPGHDPA